MYSVGLIALFDAINGKDVDEDIDEIIVDTTHGINYFAIMTQLMSRDIASILSVKLKKEIRVRFYNAIPSSNEEFVIVKVNTDAKPRIRTLEDISDRGLLIPYNALIYNAPLALSQYLQESKIEIPSLDSVYDKVNLKNKAGKLVVDYNLREQKAKKRNDIYLNLLLKAIEDSFDVHGEVNLRVLNELTKTVYSLISEVSSAIISHEVSVLLSTVKKKGKEIVCKGKVKYSEIYPLTFETEKEKSEKCGGKLEDEIRNFIAHGGLLRNLVEVQVKKSDNLNGEDVVISYGECWKNVKDFLS
ncbi:TM1812 family CRISPR-associated protein [Sulfolobus acidocaldarius]|uniref:CRISPR-associated protein n=5 Tax=Sulfolobus acidocaldarius TaxID=2285 RepID=Q4J7E5_SULAC|nr:TM1812 family CRISPR-associated protein [Sulfolobus acidocaldarius]AAY81289.1 hypothetical protein Saci_1987 [Sulfolobus acidocaldarius DSM 639]AGE71924.1 hypothetical protein SacN8_09835 [Sulfolobus acidocaldarius N8]AGE74196.1 hypothetical protein SacRon12I_09855 [Sulfolobus acidocaldarius Ron12/I]ALU29908.1 hypothetical protein ATY89_08130 [Sulfolobus acidocaldarius]ALU32649.1 hypothetical protein ATZ20_11150 [Sulfolobus acidocaldarius]